MEIVFYILSFFVSPSPKITPSPSPTITTLPSPSPSPSPTPTSTPSPTIKPKPTPLPYYPLVTEVNILRKEHNLPALSAHPMLCTIAKERVTSLVNRGSLDQHEGFKAYRDTLKNSFHQWWETIFYGSPPKKPQEVVSTYWANSEGHKASLLSQATHGCGGIKDGYAVFVLGKK